MRNGTNRAAIVGLTRVEKAAVSKLMKHSGQGGVFLETMRPIEDLNYVTKWV